TPHHAVYAGKTDNRGTRACQTASARFPIRAQRVWARAQALVYRITSRLSAHSLRRNRSRSSTTRYLLLSVQASWLRGYVAGAHGKAARQLPTTRLLPHDLCETYPTPSMARRPASGQGNPAGGR